MNTKFASLGTALSRDEAKKVMGGLTADEDLGDDLSAICNSCTTDEECGGLRVCRSSPSCIQAKVCAKPYMC